MRRYRGLILLVLVTSAALAAGLVLASRDESRAAGPGTTAVAAATTETAATTGGAERSPQQAAPSKTGLVYGPRARERSLRLQAESWIAIDAESGEVLIAHRDRAKRPIASLTKMMTALLVIEQGELGRMVTVPFEATQVEPNKEGLVAGAEYPRRLLLYSMMLESANDSAAALGYDAGSGSINRFFRRMNARARSLGMSDTRYRSASGLNDVGNHSSARDQVILARHALQEPLFAKVVGTRVKRVAWAPPTYEKEWVNLNELLGTYAGTYGVKTGYTSEAGHCLVAAVERDGRSVIAVVLGSNSIWSDMRRLVDRAFALQSPA